MKAARRTGSRKVVNEANLEALGAERLASILLETAEDDAALKRRLRMELAAEVGADDLAVEIVKRMTAISGRRSRVHWRRYWGFVRELDLMRRMIVERLGALDARMALERLWAFLALSRQVFRQVDDSRGEVEAVFRAAVEGAGELVARAQPNPAQLADQLIAALEEDREQVLDQLAAAIAPALNSLALEILQAAVTEAAGPLARAKHGFREALRAIADAKSDPDAFAATFVSSDRQRPEVGVQIAQRLLKAGRAEEAVETLMAARPSPRQLSAVDEAALAWEQTAVAAYEALGWEKDAQALRWTIFERSLDAGALRAFLRRLPDFEDVEALDRAMDYALAFRDATAALAFLTAWPAPAQAAQLVQRRARELRAPAQETLEAGAHLLAARHPLAAILILRRLVEGSGRGNADEGETARRLDEMASLAQRVEDWSGAETQAAFEARLGRR